MLPVRRMVGCKRWQSFILSHDVGNSLILQTGPRRDMGARAELDLRMLLLYNPRLGSFL